MKDQPSDPGAEMMAGLNRLADNHGRMKIPPPIFEEMQAEVIAYDEQGKSLTVRFPVQAKYENPLGYMQGGMIAAAVDNTMGPLSFLVAPPSVTTQLNLSYVRPVTPETAEIFVRAAVTEQTRRQIFMEVRVYTADDKTLALAYASCMVI